MDVSHERNIRFLLSYHYYGTRKFDEFLHGLYGDHLPTMFLDSGAWSAFTQGATIELDAYIEFVSKYKHLLEVYCNLDDMENPDLTVVNQDEMIKQGLNPLPVFHTGEDFKYLEQYCEQYPYVALGKIIPYTTAPKTIIPWIVKCFRIANKYGAKFHGLGVTNWKLVSSFPWYSVDSSSWGAGYRFGRIPYFDSRKKKIESFAVDEKKKKRQARRYYERYGYAATDFAQRCEQVVSAGMGMFAYKEAEMHQRERHGEITIDGRKNGLNLYMASSCTPAIKQAFKAWERGIKEEII